MRTTVSTPLEALTLKLHAHRELPSPDARRALRRAAGITQQDIARAVGVTPQCVAWWESGQRSPKHANLERYLDVLRVLRGEAG